jgi:hypothetical protein
MAPNDLTAENMILKRTTNKYIFTIFNGGGW